MYTSPGAKAGKRTIKYREKYASPESPSLVQQKKQVHLFLKNKSKHGRINKNCTHQSPNGIAKERTHGKNEDSSGSSHGKR